MASKLHDATSPPSPSALTTLLSSVDTPQDALPLQILYNLRHMHQWSQLSLHTFETSTLTPVTLLSGVPPHHIYIHPDKQAYMIEHNITESDLPIDREWVLPIALGEKWTLKRFAGVFESLPDQHESATGRDVKAATVEDAGRELEHVALREVKSNRLNGEHGAVDGDATNWSHDESLDPNNASKMPKFGGQRILLAMVTQGLMGGDGTVVYYFMGEGEVKPRQN